MSPGWYPDPAGGLAVRWFNGTDWAYQYQAPPQQFTPPPSAQRRFTIHYGFVVVAVISLLLTVVPSIFWFSAASGAANDPNDTQHVGTTFSAGMGLFWLLWGGMWTLIWTAFAIHHTLRGRQR